MGRVGAVAWSVSIISDSETSPVTTSPVVDVSRAAARLSSLVPACRADPRGISSSSEPIGENSCLALIQSETRAVNANTNIIARVQVGRPKVSNNPEMPP